MSKERVTAALDEAIRALDEYVRELEPETITGDGYGHISPHDDLLQALYASKLMSRLIEESKCDILDEQRRSW